METETKEPLHACGKCGGTFETNELYLEHTCEATGFTPKEAEHENFDPEIAAGALAAGEARKAEEAV